MKKLRLLPLILLLLLLAGVLLSPALAFKSESLRYGMRGEEVRKMQQALIDLHYLGGTADGVFGTNTENAVRKFQRKNSLKVDGVAGSKTLEVLYRKAYGTTPTPTATPTPTPTSRVTETETATPTPTPTKTPTTGKKLFGGNYASIKLGMIGNRVKTLQSALKTLKFYTGKLDGKFGSNTRKAVLAFQKAKKLKADGIAGKKTLQALEKAVGGTDPTPTPKTTEKPTDPEEKEEEKKVAIPKIGSVKLLHWFNDVKPSLSSRQVLTIVDPATGLSWKLRLYSCGRHADAEPLTAADTASMVKAFGGKHTWDQKAVYVKLPSGAWTIGSTHDMPHMSGSIGDNNFNGHLCVHFLRDMSECQKNDPKYGVANQKTIRAFWKSLTGETVN